MFEVGDRVIGIGIIDGNNLNGCIGTVVGYYSDDDKSLVAVEFDDKIMDGHGCDGQGQHGYCWYCQDGKLKSYSDKDLFTKDEINNILGIL